MLAFKVFATRWLWMAGSILNEKNSNRSENSWGLRPGPGFLSALAKGGCAF